MSLTWQDARPIGEALFDKHGNLDPLTVRFTDLHKWVCELPDFKGDPKQSNEKYLETIQMIWYEEWKEAHGDD